MDIRPLCDRHLLEMHPAELTQNMSANETWNFPVFRCPELGCTRVFDSRGYFNVVDGERDLEEPLFIGCEHGAIFIARVEAVELVWRGSKIACSEHCERRTMISTPKFLRHAGAITGLARDLSTRTGFSNSRI